MKKKDHNDRDLPLRKIENRKDPIPIPNFLEDINKIYGPQLDALIDGIDPGLAHGLNAGRFMPMNRVYLIVSKDDEKLGVELHLEDHFDEGKTIETFLNDLGKMDPKWEQFFNKMIENREKPNSTPLEIMISVMRGKTLILKIKRAHYNVWQMDHSIRQENPVCEEFLEIFWNLKQNHTPTIKWKVVEEDEHVASHPQGENVVVLKSKSSQKPENTAELAFDLQRLTTLLHTITEFTQAQTQKILEGARDRRDQEEKPILDCIREKQWRLTLIRMRVEIKSRIESAFAGLFDGFI